MLIRAVQRRVHQDQRNHPCSKLITFSLLIQTIEIDLRAFALELENSLEERRRCQIFVILFTQHRQHVAAQICVSKKQAKQTLLCRGGFGPSCQNLNTVSTQWTIVSHCLP